MKRLIAACTLLFLLSVSCFAEYQAVARTTDALAGRSRWTDRSCGADRML